MAPPITFAFRGGASPKGSLNYAMTPSQVAAAIGIPVNATARKYPQPIPQNQNPLYAGSTPGVQPRYLPTVTPSSRLNPPVPNPTDGPVYDTRGGQYLGGAPGDPNATFVPSAGAITTTDGTNSGTSTDQNTPDKKVQWKFPTGDKTFSQRDLETMLNDPYTFQRQFLNTRGLNTPGANAALGRFASRLMPLSFVLGASQMAPDEQGDLAAIASLYNDLLSNYTTPGAALPSPSDIMNAILGTGEIANGADPANLMQSLLVGQDPRGQVQAINQIMGAALAGMPGMWGDAWASLFDQLGTNYLDSEMDANNGLGTIYLNHLNNNPFITRFAGR